MSVLVHGRDPQLRADLVAAVRSAGYEASEIGALREIERRVAESGARLVIFDMTDARCPATIRELRAQAPETGILAIGGEAGPGPAVAALRNGAHSFLRKPFGVASLERALADAMGARSRTLHNAGLIAEDPTSRRALAALAHAANSEAPVLITGDPGVGKSRVARWLHDSHPRRIGPFVSVECAELSETDATAVLCGSELDEHTARARVGRFEAAHGGTLVLEGVEAIPRALQATVVDVLQTRTVRPVGATSSTGLDVRFIATTRADLQREVREGRLAQELVYRLDVIATRLPSLRERSEDIAPLCDHFLDHWSSIEGTPRPELGANARAALEARDFPGNVRELEMLMRRAVLLFPGATIELAGLDGASDRAPRPTESLRESFDLRTLERETIARSLRATAGNRTAAARALGISVRTLRNKIRRYEL